MDSTWWVNSHELDDDQKSIIGAPLEESQLILGPPGSGKSNLLLLRADYLQRAGYPNSIILVFTRQLQDFMHSGSAHYSFPLSKIKTVRSWAFEHLREYDCVPELSNDFEKSRIELCNSFNSLIEEQHIGNLYEYILLDEVQDYLPEEIDLFRKLSRHIFAVGDIKQKIYSGSDGLSYLRNQIDKVYNLKFHYRNGLQLCRLADGIAKQTDDYISMESTCNYNEKEAPSSVDISQCKSSDEMFELLLNRIVLQMKAYPNEFIGVLTPRKEELGIISDFFKGTKLFQQGKIQLRENLDNGISENSPIIVSTMHSAKGMEFRALHLCCLEYVKKFSKQRNISFTGVTRAKTALYIYHIDGLPGYFEQALTNIKRPSSLPLIDDLFVREGN